MSASVPPPDPGAESVARAQALQKQITDLVGRWAREVDYFVTHHAHRLPTDDYASAHLLVGQARSTHSNLVSVGVVLDIWKRKLVAESTVSSLVEESPPSGSSSEIPTPEKES